MGWWDGFRYEATERRALLGWVGISLLLLGARSPRLPWNQTPEIADLSSRFLPLLDSIQAYKKDHYRSLIRGFEVHSVDSAGLVAMGCDAYSAQRWVRYLNRGYTFRDTAQLHRVVRPDPLWWAVASAQTRFERGSSDYISMRNGTFASNRERPQVPTIRFPFSTDSLDVTDFEQLGLSPAQASVAVRFCAGRALDAAALSKLRVVSPELFAQWKPWIRPQQSVVPSETVVLDRTPFDWNALGAAELARRLSWDPERAERLVEYRRRLGGYTGLDQLLLDRKISRREYEQWSEQGWDLFGPPTKLSLNESPLEVLASHPYLGYRSARALVQFRESVRPFRSVEELRKLHLIEDSVWAKLVPYLEVRF